MSGIMFILPHYTTELNTNNLHILSTPFPGVPDLFSVVPRSEGSPRLHSTLQKGESHLGTSATQPTQLLQMSLQSFPDLEPTEAKEETLPDSTGQSNCPRPC